MQKPAEIARGGSRQRLDTPSQMSRDSPVMTTREPSDQQETTLLRTRVLNKQGNTPKGRELTADAKEAASSKLMSPRNRPPRSETPTDTITVRKGPNEITATGDPAKVVGFAVAVLTVGVVGAEVVLVWIVAQLLKHVT